MAYRAPHSSISSRWPAKLSFSGYRVARRSSRSLWLLNEDANGLAGIVLGERWEDGTGYIDSLAVAARARGQGLGRAMLLHGLNALKDAGLVRAELSVQGENASASALYESVGMRPISTTERWEKPLRAM